MGLFTNPVVLNNGIARSFEYMGQLIDPKAMTGRYLESAAANDIMSYMTAKHTVNGSIVRSLLQRTVLAPTSESKLEPITANFTLTYNIKHLTAVVEPEAKLITAALGATNFYANFIKKLV